MEHPDKVAAASASFESAAAGATITVWAASFASVAFAVDTSATVAEASCSEEPAGSRDRAPSVAEAPTAAAKDSLEAASRCPRRSSWEAAAVALAWPSATANSLNDAAASWGPLLAFKAAAKDRSASEPSEGAASAVAEADSNAGASATELYRPTATTEAAIEPAEPAPSEAGESVLRRSRCRPQGPSCSTHQFACSGSCGEEPSSSVAVEAAAEAGKTSCPAAVTASVGEGEFAAADNCIEGLGQSPCSLGRGLKEPVLACRTSPDAAEPNPMADQVAYIAIGRGVAVVISEVWATLMTFLP